VSDDVDALKQRLNDAETALRRVREAVATDQPAPCVDCITGAHGPNAHRKHLPPSPAAPAAQCGAGTLGMYGRLLGPCLHSPGHPTDLLHRDTHGAEWCEYDHTDSTSVASNWEQQENGTWTLPIDGGTILFTRRSTPEERARFAEAWAQRRAAAQVEDLLRVAHDTSNRSEAERALAVQRAEAAEQRRDQLGATLEEVLGHFIHKGFPGEPCIQTGWIRVQTVDRWRAVAYPTKDGNK
jgi:hypothetical protein